jgi:hypothetical protein
VLVTQDNICTYVRWSWIDPEALFDVQFI